MRCRFRWCTAPHATLESVSQHIGEVAGFANLALRLMLIERPGNEPDSAVVRLVSTANGRRLIHDVTPQAAIDWAEILDSVDIRDLSSIAQALHRAGSTGAAP